jgi:hypothetical protein
VFPWAFEAQFAVPHGDHAALCAVPADVARLAPWVLGSGHRLGRQHQELFDELARELAQQIIDGQLGLPDHREQRQSRLLVGGKQGLFAQLIDIEFAGDTKFGFRLFHGG